MSRKVEGIKKERDGQKHSHNVCQNSHKPVQFQDIK